MRKSNRSLLSNIIEFVDPTTLQMPADLIHKEDALHIEKVSDSIESLDFLDPVLVGPGNEIIDGVSRVKAAMRQGLSGIPTLRLPDATPNEMKAIRIALNKLPKGAHWNQTTLRTNINDLMGQGFDVLKLGFDAGELDKLLAPLEVAAEASVQVTGQDEACTVIVGDAFTMGPHSIACGDCRDPDLVATLLSSEVAAACAMDPPYNVPIAGHVSGLGANQHAEFAMASGEMTPKAFGEFLQTVMQVANSHIRPGGYQYVFMDWRSIHLLVHAGKAIGLDHINICTWVKPNAGMGSLYRSQHEMVGVFRKPGGKSTNNVQLGKYGRSRSNVWDYRGANSFGPSRSEDLKDHPTVKPVELIEDIIKDCTKRGEIVLDLFGGSGAAMLAAERCGRRARLVEIAPRYVEVTLRRMRKMFGIDATHVQTGLSFEELSEQRRQSTAVQPHTLMAGTDVKIA
jgi:DNA modification methylase